MSNQHIILRRASSYGFDPGNRSHIFLFIFPVIYLAIMMAIFLANNDLFWVLLHEGGPLESFQAISYLFASIIALSLAIKFRHLNRRILFILYIVLSLALLFVMFEEISWGQRIIGFETPEMLNTQNIQQETTFHNLDVIQNNLLHPAYVIVGLGAALFWLLIPDSISRQWSETLSYLVPSPLVMMYFLPVGIYYIYLEGVLKSYWPDFGATKA